MLDRSLDKYMFYSAPRRHYGQADKLELANGSDRTTGSKAG